MDTFGTGPKCPFKSNVCLTESQIKGVTKGRQGPTLGVRLIEVSDKRNCKRFEPRSHFISRLSMIIRVNVVLNRTVVVDSD